MICRILVLATVLALACLPTGVAAQGGVPARTQPNGHLTLAEAVALALDTHPSLGQARAQRDAAAAGVALARGALLPSLSSQGSLARFQEPMVVAPLHGFDPARPPTFDRSLVQGTLALSYTVFDGGARRARRAGAGIGEEAAALGEERGAMDVTLQVSAAYLEVLTGRELVSAARRQQEALEAERARVAQFLEEGKAARVDLLRVEAALSRARASDIAAGADLDAAWGRLARLLGMEEEELRGRNLASVALAPAPDLSLEEAMAAALGRSPEMALARKEVAGSAAEARSARAAWFPRVEAGGQLQSFGTVDGGHAQEWNAILRISYPLFTGGARGGEVERAAARELQASEGLRLAEMRVADQVDEALAALAGTRAMRHALSLAVEQSEEVSRIEALALEAGAGVQTDYLRAEADLLEARAALARARHGEILARIGLARAMGDLDLGWLDETLEVVR